MAEIVVNPGSGMKRGVQYLWLGAVPLLLAALWWPFHTALGPHYLGKNADPDYVYLFNSLNLARHFPDYTEYNFWIQQYYQFDRLLADADPGSVARLFVTNPCVVFQGGIPVFFEQWPVRLPAGVKLRPLYDCAGEIFYWAGTDQSAPDYQRQKERVIAFVKNPPLEGK